MSNSLKNLLNQEKSLIDAYNSGDTNKVLLEASKDLNDMEQVRKAMVEFDFIEHFINFNKTVKAQKEFVGSLIQCSFDKALVNTSNTNVLNQHGIAVGSLLIAALPNHIMQSNLTEHFLLLRVNSKVIEDNEVASTLQLYDKVIFSSDAKKYNQNEEHEIDYQDGSLRAKNKSAMMLQLQCNVLGMYYRHAETQTFEFTPQIDCLLAASHYLVYKPNNELLNVIINTQMILDAKLGKHFDYFPIGVYRETESEAFLPNAKLLPRTTVYESISMFINARTANYGNTRFGKSNLNKIYATNIIKYNAQHKDELHKRIGMLIYDENGEYYHVNTQDNTSLYEKHKHSGVVERFSLKKTQKNNLMLNFYYSPYETLKALRVLLGEKGDRPIYIESFLSMDLTENIYWDVMFNHHYYENYDNEDSNVKDFILSIYDRYSSEKYRSEEIFKLQLFWALLKIARFNYALANKNSPFFESVMDYKDNVFDIPDYIIEQMKTHLGSNDFCQNIDKIISSKNNGDSLEKKFTRMCKAIDVIVEYYLENKNDLHKQSNLWQRLEPLLEMFNASASKGGYKKLYSLHDMHSEYSYNAIDKLIDAVVEDGKVVILDLSSTNNAKAKRFYAEKIDTAIFKRAEYNFSQAKTKSKPYILLNYEEAHNLFPTSASSSSIYIKLAREGAKMHIGIIYNTQLITHIYSELKSLTENIFVGYINDQKEISDLSTVNYAFRNSGHEIMTIRKVGYMFVLTRNRRFPIRVQIAKFE